MSYRVQDLYNALGKLIAEGHSDDSILTTDQDGQVGEVLDVFVNDLSMVEIEIGYMGGSQSHAH